ncbi:RnfH family protein [Undibacterium sp. CY7W]|uniref:UPF0125 protein H8K47_08885 n=1 Tax=Undibacterium rugosum TaxID=2762291 RepID=A0A923IA77_9BURK|nr:RnfH family protein [Undibacterium rugosum]MBC3935475.1 RnfH family protein [Undibacterium rugosum]
MPDAVAEPVISVQIVYADQKSIVRAQATLAPTATVHEAILKSGIIQTCPAIDISVLKVGVFGKLKPLDAALHDGDRIEIYRPLSADPMEARRRRAKKQARQSASG